MSDIRSIVAEYYAAIDRADTGWVVSIFAEEATYRRADIDYPGLAAIRNFFCEKRKIRGRHNVSNIWTDETSRTAFVTGHFSGEGDQGDPRAMDFADVWHFNEENLVARRQTFLGLGHAYIER